MNTVKLTDKLTLLYITFIDTKIEMMTIICLYQDYILYNENMI